MLSATRNFSIFALLICFLSQCRGLGFTTFSSNESPLVTTSTGIVQGICLDQTESDVTAFFGIPFAEPPIGDLRFKKPVPVKNWQGVYKATKKSPPCMQYSTKKFPWQATSAPSEDCLFLNLWIPGKFPLSEADQDLKPVLVWIHGGGYYSGSSDLDMYDGTTMSTHSNVIVASINYRVGSFGFFASNTEDAPGNMGLYDQNLALTWLKNNVMSFGGDPNKITLFGESSGALSTMYHIISPLSRSLFQRAIIQSGSPYHPSVGGSAQQIFASNIFSIKAGCADETNNLFTNPKKVISCLQEKNALELSKQEDSFLQVAPYFFLPISGDEFIPENPIRALDTGNFKEIEILIGINQDEGAVFLNYLLPQIFDKITSPVLSISQARNIIQLMFQNSTHPSPKQVADFYLENVNENNSGEIVKAISDSYGDFVFSCPSIFAAEKFDKSPVYFYYFTQRPSNSQWGDWMGATHMEEVPFVFGYPLRHPNNYTVNERRFSDNIMQMWSNFAKYGTPVPSKSTTVWPTYTAANPQVLELNAKSTKIERGPRTEFCNFWRPYFVSVS